MSVNSDKIYTWSICLACLATTAQDDKDQIFPSKIIEILSRDGATITR